MTLIAAPDAVEGTARVVASPTPRRALVEHVAVGAAIVWWSLPLTYAGGGRDRWVQTVGIGLAVVALLALRVWRTASTTSMVLAASIGVVPLVVCLVDPTHWYAASQAATYAYAVMCFLAVRAYGTSPVRRTWILGLVLMAGLTQFAWAFVAWHDAGLPEAAMIGRFFWHNQFAAFLLAPAVIGVGLATRWTGSLRLLAAFTAVLGCAGIVLSTSRATMALLACGWLTAGIIGVAASEGRRQRLLAAVRWAALSGATWAALFVMTGPPLFAHRVWAFAGTSVRGAGQPVTQNGAYRGDFWRQSWALFGRHPATGGGFGSFGRQSALLDPSGPHASFVHNGFLQAFSDGGLLLGVPFTLGSAALALGLLARLRQTARRVDAVSLLALAGLLLSLHSAVDFDWSYPSLMVLSAVVAGLALAWSPPSDLDAAAVARTGMAARVALAALIVSGLVLAQHAVPGGWFRNAPADPSAASAPGASVS